MLFSGTIISFLFYSYHYCRLNPNISKVEYSFNLANVVEPYFLILKDVSLPYVRHTSCEPYYKHYCTVKGSFCGNDQYIATGIYQPFKMDTVLQFSIVKYWIHLTPELSILFACPGINLDCLLNRPDQFIFIGKRNSFANKSIAAAFAKELQIDVKYFDANYIKTIIENRSKSYVNPSFTVSQKSATPLNGTTVAVLGAIWVAIICGVVGYVLLRSHKRKNLVYPVGE